MKRFGLFLRSRRGSIAFFVLLAVLLLCSFALYQLPLAAVAYPCGLGALLGLSILAWDYLRVQRRSRRLEQYRVPMEDVLEHMSPPESPEAADDLAIIRALCTELRQTREKAGADYAAMVDYYTLWVHQIKTPIASMRLQLQNADTPAARSARLDLGRIERYVDMVLAYLRLDSHDTDYVIRECDLDGIVRPAVKKFAGEFISRGLKLKYAPLNTRVLTDEKWLGFVVEQLLSNALKYTPAGTVSISLEQPKTLCIRDTGIGIAPEDLPRIFDRGYTGMPGRTDRRASGIGLYLCSRICRNLGHTLRAESVPGEGTVMRLELGTRNMPLE